MSGEDANIKHNGEKGKTRQKGGWGYAHKRIHRHVFSQSTAMSTSSLSGPNGCEISRVIGETPDISTSMTTVDGPDASPGKVVVRSRVSRPAPPASRSNLSIAREVMSSRARCRRATSGSWRSKLATLWLWLRSPPWPFAASFNHCGGEALPPRYVHVPSASAAARTGSGVRLAPAPVVCVAVDVPASAVVCVGVTVAAVDDALTRMVCCRSCANLNSAATARACLSRSLASLLSVRPWPAVPSAAAAVVVDADADLPPAPPFPAPPLPPVRECSPPCP